MKYLIILLFTFTLSSCASTKDNESAGQYVDNTAISVKVKSKLLSSSKVSGTSIDVESYKGTVILSGFVGSEEEKEMAIDIAEKVEGVKDVKNALYVKSDVTSL